MFRGTFILNRVSGRGRDLTCKYLAALNPSELMPLPMLLPIYVSVELAGLGIGLGIGLDIVVLGVDGQTSTTTGVAMIGICVDEALGTCGRGLALLESVDGAGGGIM